MTTPQNSEHPRRSKRQALQKNFERSPSFHVNDTKFASDGAGDSVMLTDKFLSTMNDAPMANSVRVEDADSIAVSQNVCPQDVSELSECGHIQHADNTSVSGGISADMLLQLVTSQNQAINQMTEVLQAMKQQMSDTQRKHPCEKVVRVSDDLNMQKCGVHKMNEHTSDSSESDSERESDSDDHLFQSKHRQAHTSNCRLPPFTGKEKWEVWHNRFQDVARRSGWSDDEKLDRLLPRLQGLAGDFVLSQLNLKTRSSYKRLTRELSNRFKVVEVAKTYQLQFHRRNQKVSETVEDYSAELKRLYDKGYATRPSSVRQEDLLRKFLDGLLDHKVRQQVEFVKQPTDIDEAGGSCKLH